MKNPVRAMSLSLLIMRPKQPVNVPLSNLEPKASPLSGGMKIAGKKVYCYFNVLGTILISYV